MEEPLSLSTSLDNFLAKASQGLKKFEDGFKNSPSPTVFMQKGGLEILKWSVIPAYKQLYLDLKVFERKDLDELLKNPQDEQSKKSVQEFIKFEDSVNELLVQIDAKIDQSSNVEGSKALQVGDIFPSDLELKEVTTKKTYKTDSSLFFKSVDGEFIKHCIVVLMRKYS